jgi:hypothetical protein
MHTAHALTHMRMHTHTHAEQGRKALCKARGGGELCKEPERKEEEEEKRVRGQAID